MQGYLIILSHLMSPFIFQTSDYKKSTLLILIFFHRKPIISCVPFFFGWIGLCGRWHPACACGTHERSCDGGDEVGMFVSLFKAFSHFLKIGTAFQRTAKVV